MGSIMSNQQTANYALRFATFAADLACEFKGGSLGAMVARQASDMIEHAGYIQALAQEAQTLNTDDPEEVLDFQANWQMGMTWWNQMVTTFTRGFDAHTQRRIKLHMEAFLDEA